MQPARIVEHYAVAPQIAPEDAAAIRAMGYTDVICNRPDEEVPPDLAAAAIGDALATEGVRFHVVPIRPGGLGPEEIARHAEIVAAAAGPVLAYCRSGTRSAIVWALGEPRLDADAIVAAAAGAGYDLAPYRPHLGNARG
jgi:uncharacterized protein (TIGR01244 family)